MRLDFGATWVRVDLCTNLLGYELTLVRFVGRVTHRVRTGRIDQV